MTFSLFNKLAAAEEQFLSSTFLAPVLKHHPVRVRVAGVIYTLAVTPKTYQGWGVFRPTSHHDARLQQEASLSERRQYLDLFPSLRLILCRKENGTWFGIHAHHDKRFRVSGLVPVALCEEVQLFETVRCRWDGNTAWFDAIESRADPRVAPYLREALGKLLEHDKLALPGLSQQARDAYGIQLTVALEADKEARRDKQEERIKAALQRAGAVYRNYIDRGNTFTVEFAIGGESHRSVVKKEDLGVVSAGICLNYTDALFDLQSLATVVLEGQRRQKIVRVGDNHGDHNHGSEDDQDDW